MEKHVNETLSTTAAYPPRSYRSDFGDPINLTVRKAVMVSLYTVIEKHADLLLIVRQNAEENPEYKKLLELTKEKIVMEGLEGKGHILINIGRGPGR